MRQFTQDDAHIYCRPDQVQAEIADLLALVREWYGLLRARRRPSGWPRGRRRSSARSSSGTRRRRPSTRPCGANQLPYDLDKGGAAFYGPKIDIDVEDALGRKWQLATIQVDLTMLPERMQCEYIDTDGQPKRPVVIHRAIFGSYDRFIAILTEHFAGAFPTWLAPVQARVLPISEKHAEYGRAVHAKLRDARASARSSTIATRSSGYRIRDAQVRKVPYTLVVGEREAQNGTASVRARGGEDLGALPLERVLEDPARRDR